MTSLRYFTAHAHCLYIARFFGWVGAHPNYKKLSGALNLILLNVFCIVRSALNCNVILVNKYSLTILDNSVNFVLFFYFEPTLAQWQCRQIHEG